MVTASRRIHLTALLALAIATALHAPARGQITQQWLTQWGTSADEIGWGVAVDGAGKTWVTGYTSGALGGTNAGGADLFLTPLSTSGTLGTSVQRGGPGDDLGWSVAVVGGTVFGVGYTSSPTWDGATALGGQDAVAVGYSTAGVWQSTARFGSTGSDQVFGAVGNASHLLTAGFATGTIDGQPRVGFQSDAFLSKRASSGALVWTRVVSTSEFDGGRAAAIDSAGYAYMAGLTQGSLPTFTNAGGNDLFVTRYDASGTQTLLKQWGTGGDDRAYGMQVDGSGNIYLTGYTTGTLGGQTNNGGQDALLTKLDSSGNVLWTRLLGGTGDDISNGLALDAAGHVWIGGYSGSSFAGHTNANNSDAFVAQYDSAGNLLNTMFWATAGTDYVTGLAAAPDGSVSVSGWTQGTLGVAYLGGADAWAASLTTVPEPTTPLLLSLSGAGLLLLRRRA